MTTEPALPVRYSDLARSRRSLPVAAGACSVSGCAYDRPGRVYDHCHKHDYVRGVICLGCNAAMVPVDARAMPESLRSQRAKQQHAALLAHWSACPECAAVGWEPYRTAREYQADQVIASVVRLADELAGRIATRPESPRVAPIADQLAALDARIRLLTRLGRLAT